MVPAVAAAQQFSSSLDANQRADISLSLWEYFFTFLVQVEVPSFWSPLVLFLLLSIIKWLSISLCISWVSVYVPYMCYCMLALLLFSLWAFQTLYHLCVFYPILLEFGKGQVASRSHPLFRGDISGKRPPSPSLVGVACVWKISLKRDITVVYCRDWNILRYSQQCWFSLIWDITISYNGGPEPTFNLHFYVTRSYLGY